MGARKPFKYVNHMADVEYIAHGKDVEECFTNALMAMFDTISYKSRVSNSKSANVFINIKDKAKNIEDLLWYTLQDTLSMTDSKGLFAYKVSDLKINESNGSCRINARICAKAKEDRAIKLDVKGVARYNLWIKKKKDGTYASVVLDV